VWTSHIAIGPSHSFNNLPIIIAAALWTTVLTMVLGILADAILGQLDPRVRGAAL